MFPHCQQIPLMFPAFVNQQVQAVQQSECPAAWSRWLDPKSPFNQQISEYRLPDGFKIPKFELYDGSTDADDHLRLFKSTLYLYALPEPAWCRLFHNTITGEAARWLSSLSPHSISTFSQLVESFLSYFSFKRKYPTCYIQMHSLKQKPDEALIEFVTRFNERVLDVGERMDSLMISAFIHGLQPSLLRWDLALNLPITLEELMGRVHNFHCAQEALSRRMNLESQTGQPRGRARRWAQKKFEQSDVGSTSSSDSLDERKCILEFDAAVEGNSRRAGAGVVLRDEDTSLVYCLREGLGITNKGVADYQALILGLRYALERGYTHIRVEGYSRRVCMQVHGSWRTKSHTLSNLCEVAKELKEKFVAFEICHVKWDYDSEIDNQAHMAVHLEHGEVQEGGIGDNTPNFEPLPKGRLKSLSTSF